ncbi:flagellar biosynthesis repressor FlbT [Methylobacterium sp.]|uniref:flagellar biosynthesis repressor FlbT n=2 Tax=unclassified Methylobacterium TaxID=2615210 RepID=UPI00351DC557
MRLSLRAGERVFVNGAVLRVDRKVSLELLNDATFLLETHVLQPEEATTPLRQLYFAAQTMVIEPANAARARELYRALQAGILDAVTDPALRDGLAAAGACVEADRLIEALKLIRGLYRSEAALFTADPGPAIPIVDPAGPPGPGGSPTREPIPRPA